MFPQFTIPLIGPIEPITGEALARMVQAVVIVLVAALVASLASRGVTRLLQRRGSSEGAQHVVGRVVRYLVWILGAFSASSALGIDLLGVLAASAALLVGIGFGLQKIAQDLVAGLLLLMEQHVRKGDFVSVGTRVGTVDFIGARSTRLLTRDGIAVIVPNAELTGAAVQNFSRPQPGVRIWLALRVAYGSALEPIRERLVAVALGNPRIQPTPAPEVRFDRFGDFAIELSLVVWVRVPREDLMASSELRYAMYEALQAMGVEIPLPQQVLQFKPPNEPGPPA